MLKTDSFVLFKISSKEFSNTLAASSVSLATVISFFVSTYHHYGLILLLCIPTYIAGQYGFVMTLDKFKVSLSSNRTLGDIVKESFQSSLIASMVDLVNVTALLSIIFLDLYIGSQILGLFFTSVSQFSLFFWVAIVTFIYVGNGGFKAVIRSDFIQLHLMLFSFIFLLIFTLLDTDTIVSVNKIQHQHFFGTASPLEMMTLLLVMVMINFLLPYTSVVAWHRVIATQNCASAKKGIRQSMLKIILIWGIPIILVSYMFAFGHPVSSLNELFSLIFSSNSMIAICLKYIMAVSFIACIMSSVDTAIIGIIFTFKKPIFKVENSKLSVPKKINFLIISIFISQLILYLFCLTSLRDFILFATFAIFGQLIILFPVIILALYYLKNGIHRKTSYKKQIIISLAILAGLINIFALTYVSEISGTTFWSQIAPLISISIVFVSLFCSLSFKESCTTASVV